MSDLVARLRKDAEEWRDSQNDDNWSSSVEHIALIEMEAADEIERLTRERDALALQVKMQPAPMADCPVYCKTAVALKDEADQHGRDADEQAHLRQKAERERDDLALELREERDNAGRVHEALSAAEHARDEAVALLKEARDALDGLPRSLGYDITHIARIDALLGRLAG